MNKKDEKFYKSFRLKHTRKQKTITLIIRFKVEPASPVNFKYTLTKE